MLRRRSSSLRVPLRVRTCPRVAAANKAVTYSQEAVEQNYAHLTTRYGSLRGFKMFHVSWTVGSDQGLVQNLRVGLWPLGLIHVLCRRCDMLRA